MKNHNKIEVLQKFYMLLLPFHNRHIHSDPEILGPSSPTKLEKNLIYKDEVFAIRIVMFEVYREMGCGFLEVFYLRTLSKGDSCQSRFNFVGAGHCACLFVHFTCAGVAARIPIAFAL
jgi:hypothetical protein